MTMQSELGDDAVSTASEVIDHPATYRAIAPLAQVKFVDTNEIHSMESAEVEPYGAASAGLISYGGLRSLNEKSPLFAHHLRVDRSSRLVVSGRQQLPDASLLPRERLEGKWLYGGELMHHFGHFMAESSHRIHPALNESAWSRYSGIVFGARAIKPWHKALLTDHYGLPPEKFLFVRDRVVVIDELDIAPQGSILGGAAIAPGYIDILSRAQQRLRRSNDLPTRLLIGRNHLSTGGGGVTNEAEIQTVCDRFSLTPVRPEEFSLVDQLSMMANAECIVMIGGSAVHLFDHLGNSNAAVLLISRGDPDSFYHSRSLESKVASLTQITPDSEFGDQVARNDQGTRATYSTTYAREPLLDRLESFLTASAL